MRLVAAFLSLFIPVITLSASDTLALGEAAGATIPCFDFTQIKSASESERAVMIRKFGDGLRDIGFVAVYAPEVTPKVEEATRVMKRYFAQSEAVKMQDWHQNNGQTGFSFKGLESAAGSKAADNKETFFIVDDMTRWPNAPAEFKVVMRDYLATLSDYSSQILMYLWEYLGEIEDAHDQAIHEGDKRIRLAYYPAPQKNDNPRSVWAAAHQDLNAVTLLPRPSRSGLQLKTKEGNWLPVTVPQDYIIINCGDQITKKTAGYITGTEHRVINDDPDNCDARYSTILFAALPDEYSLKPFENCCRLATSGMNEEEAAAYLKPFTDVTVTENLMGRLIEMDSWSNPSEELIQTLQSKGLITNPCKSLRKKFPHLFP